MSSEDAGRTAAVVGGGIGGLASAIALRHAGWRVTVYERAPRFAEVGAGISLMRNALAGLEALGVAAEVRRLAVADRGGALRTAAGRDLVHGSMDDLTGGDTIIVHRADLRAVLAAAVPPADLWTDHEVTSVDSDGRVTANGATREFDLVVAADGVWSTCRGHHWPKVRVRRTGVRAWRWIVDAPPRDFVGEILGADGEFGVLPLSGDRTYVFAGARIRSHPDGPGRGPAGLDVFADWADPVPRLIAEADPARVLTSELVEVRPPRTLHRGRIALLGDAAHAMRPHLGQGAALAIEDAVTLAATAPDLAAYTAARRWRVQALNRAAAAATRVLMPGHRLPTALRDAVFAALPDTMATAGFTTFTRWRPPAIVPPQAR